MWFATFAMLDRFYDSKSMDLKINLVKNKVDLLIGKIVWNDCTLYKNGEKLPQVNESVAGYSSIRKIQLSVFSAFCQWRIQ